MADHDRDCQGYALGSNCRCERSDDCLLAPRRLTPETLAEWRRDSAQCETWYDDRVLALLDALDAEKAHLARVATSSHRYASDREDLQQEVMALEARAERAEQYAKELERRFATVNSHGERADLIAERDEARRIAEAESETRINLANRVTELEARAKRVRECALQAEAISDLRMRERDTAEAVLSRVLADVEALSAALKAEDPMHEWGSHDKYAAARRIDALLAKYRQPAEDRPHGPQGGDVGTGATGDANGEQGGAEGFEGDT